MSVQKLNTLPQLIKRLIRASVRSRVREMTDGCFYPSRDDDRPQQ